MHKIACMLKFAYSESSVSTQLCMACMGFVSNSSMLATENIVCPGLGAGREQTEAATSLGASCQAHVQSGSPSRVCPLDT